MSCMQKSLLMGERAVCCDTCDGWYHVICMGMNTGVYEVLEQHSSATWICHQCGLPNFTSSLFTSGSMDIDISFSSLDSVDSGNQPLTSPLATSLPQMRIPSAQNVDQLQGDKNYGQGLARKTNTIGYE